MANTVSINITQSAKFTVHLCKNFYRKFIKCTVHHSGAGATTFPSMVQYVPIRLHTKRIKKADHVFAVVRIEFAPWMNY